MFDALYDILMLVFWDEHDPLPQSLHTLCVLGVGCLSVDDAFVFVDSPI